MADIHRIVITFGENQFTKRAFFFLTYMNVLFIAVAAESECPLRLAFPCPLVGFRSALKWRLSRAGLHTQWGDTSVAGKTWNALLIRCIINSTNGTTTLNAPNGEEALAMKGFDDPCLKLQRRNKLTQTPLWIIKVKHRNLLVSRRNNKERILHIHRRYATVGVSKERMR